MILCRVHRDLNWWREVFLLTAGASRTKPRVVSNLIDCLIPRAPGEKAPVTPQAIEEAQLAAKALDETRFVERAREAPVTSTMLFAGVQEALRGRAREFRQFADLRHVPTSDGSEWVLMRR